MSRDIKKASLNIYKIEGKLRLLSILLMVFILTICSWNWFKTKHALSEVSYYYNVVKAAKYQSQKLISAVHQLDKTFMSYLATEESNKAAGKNVFNKEIVHEYIELQTRANLLHDMNSKRIVLEIENTYPNLKKRLEDFYKADKKTAFYIYKRQISPIIEHIVTLCNQLIEIQEKVEYKEKVVIDKNGDILYYINLIFVLLGIPLSYIAITFIISQVRNVENELYGSLVSLRNGEPLKNFISTQSEFRDVYKSINRLSNNSTSMLTLFQEITKSNFDNSITIYEKNSPFYAGITNMKASLIEVSKTEEQRKWQSTGITILSKIIRNNHNTLEDLCDNLLVGFIDYTNSNQGAVFILNDENELEMKSMFAFGIKKHLNQNIEIGHGLIGEAFRDGSVVVITEIPEDYPKIRSGMGQAAPNCITIIPLKYQGKPIGVLEAASFENYKNYEIEFFERIAEVFAAAVQAMANTVKTQTLLKEAQEYSKQMDVQEKELRQNTIDLDQTRSLLQAELKRVKGLLKINRYVTNSDVCAIIMADQDGRIELANSLAEKTFNFKEGELVDKNIKTLIPFLNKTEISQISSQMSIQTFKALTRGGFKIEIKAIIGVSKYKSTRKYLVIIPS